MNQTEHTADYWYLEEALQSACNRLKNLEQEIACFTPKSFDELYADISKAWLGVEGVRFSNPESFFAEQTKLALPKELQLRNHLGLRLEAEFVTIVVMSSALAECLINVTLQFLYANAGIKDLYSLIDRWRFNDKWLFGPRVVIPEYAFPKDSKLWEVLTQMTNVRSRALHHRVTMKINGNQVFSEKVLFSLNGNEMILLVKQIANLPYDLRCKLTELLTVDNDPPIKFRHGVPFPDHRTYTPD